MGKATLHGGTTVVTKRMLLAALVVAGLPIWAQQSAKGIFLDKGEERKGEERKPAAKFNVLLTRDGQQKTVPASFAFRDGDQMKLQLELSQNSYVYVLHRTVEGADTERYAGTRGIEVIRDEDKKAKKRESYQLLFPNQDAGENNMIRARSAKTIPEKRSFELDDKPGMEKLLVVVSQKPLDITKYFDVKTGKLQQEPAGAGSGKPRNDSDEEVLDQLTRTLLTYGGNTAIDPSASKGIDLVDDYAAPKAGARPMLIPVDIKHLARRKE